MQLVRFVALMLLGALLLLVTREVRSLASFCYIAILNSTLTTYLGMMIRYVQFAHVCEI